MIETILGLIVAAGAGAGITSWLKRGRPASESSRAESEPDNSLFAIRGGVWIREPNGSSHQIQNRIEQALAERGMALYNLRREPAEALLRDGEWTPDIASESIDVAVVGRIVIQTFDVTEEEYISRQHIHTPTGLYFHQVDPQSGGRKANCQCHNYDFPSYLRGEPHYHESKDQFDQRRELEKTCKVQKRNIYSLDVRFYGPNGRIRGGCVAKTLTPSEDTASSELTDTLVSDLSVVLRQSIAAHSTSAVEAELGLTRSSYKP